MTDDRVFAKCAWRLIPFMMLIYLVNFIDRVNVGFAALTMNADLNFSPSVYGFGAGILFVGYALFQVPSNLILERVGARRWMFLILLVWGAISASTAFVTTPSAFYAIRFVLGIAEAGFFPGMILYLTYWFPRALRARFTANFMVAIPLSTVVGGPLSSLILALDGWGGLRGWQWLFLLEGMPAFLLAFAVLKVLPDGPQDATWLTSEEKKVIATHLTAEGSTGRCNLWSALLDVRVIALGLASFAYQASFYGVSLWLPQIVQAMGFSNTATGFVVALVSVVGAGAMILGGHSSSLRNESIWHVTLPWLGAALAFATASAVQPEALVLIALTLGVSAMLTAVGPFMSLPSSFLSGTAAASGIGLFTALGVLGAFVGPTLFGVLRQWSEDYTPGIAAAAVGMMLAGLIVLAVGRALAPRSTKLEATAR